MPRRVLWKFWVRRVALALVGLLLLARFIWLATRHQERFHARNPPPSSSTHSR